MKLLLLFSFLFSFSSLASTIDLKQKTIEYFEFRQQIGKTHEEKNYLHIIPKIFDLDCKKFENGKLIFSSSDEFAIKIKQVQSKIFPWKTKLLDILVDEASYATTIYFTLITHTKKFNIMAILRFNQDGKITEINEVYNLYHSENNNL